ncbi:hypothetical protein SUGI_1132320 [Cryptomeria japonica]|nr:hypothetical protein SUGI_1132320 [Cryptomeria japonica]
MEFQRIGVFSRTPDGYRLATLEEVSKERDKLVKQGILDDSKARVLDGVARDAPDLATAGHEIQVYSIPMNMIVYGQTPTHVPRIPCLIRKELYSQICLDNRGRIIAFLYSLMSGDIEVIHWLRHSATSSQLGDLKAEYERYEDDSDGFFKIVKWVLFENEEVRDHEVQQALDYASRGTERRDVAMEAKHAISIVEIIWAIFSRKKKVDLIYSQIKKQIESIGNKPKTKHNNHTAVLAKLFSKCAVQQLEKWNGIIKIHFETLFKDATGRGYISLVKYFLKLSNTLEDKLVHGVDNEGKTLLHYAAEWEGSKPSDDDVDAVSILLFRAYEDEFVRKVDKHGRTVLHIASLGGREWFCEFLVDEYGLENVVDEWGQNFLHYAARGKNGSRIVDQLQKKLLRDSGLASCRNNKGETPLHQAAMCGNTDMIISLRLWCKPILTKILKQIDHKGRTALHLAARHGHLKSVLELLNAGSDPLEERDISGNTVLHHVVANPSFRTEDAKALIDVLVDHFEYDGQKALFLWASAIGIGTADEMEGINPDIKQFLKEKKMSFADINLLKEAAMQGTSRLTWELLNRGGDITQIPNNREFRWVRRQLEKFSEQATDRPTIRDTLGRDVLAECIAAHFLNPYIKSPVTVSITGGSGMGKTSLMSMIEAELLVTAAQLAFPYTWQYEDFNGAKNIVLSKEAGENEEASVYEDLGQSLGAIPRILIVNFNAGNYRGRHEAWAGLALEITKEIEASMTLAQWLSTCWRNARRRHSESFYMQFIFPCLIFAFLAVWIAWAAWMLLERANDPQLKQLKYGSIPSTVIAIIWSALRGVLSIFKPVSKQLSGYFSLPDHSQQLGYQEKVISDIKFLKEEIGKEPDTLFSLIAGEKCKYWWGLWENKVEDTSVPKYSSAPENKLRMIALVDDLDHCEDEVVLRVLWAINLVFRVCEISVILAMDKNTIQTAFKNSSQNQDEDYVDKFISKIIQLPVNLPDAADDEWTMFLQQELRLSERDVGKFGVLEDHPNEDEDRFRENSETIASANEDQGLTSRLSKILSWMSREESEQYESPDCWSDQYHALLWQLLSKRIWQLREIVMQGYTEDEIQALDKLKGFATGIQKLPREWRCYINYHKFARNVIVKKTKNARLVPYTTVEFVAWNFVCWQWKHEMNILIKDWHSYTDVKDRDGHIKRKPSLKEIVANYIKRRWPGQAEAEQAHCNEEDDKKKELIRLKEALDTMQDISMKGLCGSNEFQIQCEIGKLLGWVPGIGSSILMEKEKMRKEKERWYNLLKALKVVQDVSMKGIQSFQYFRFHCDSTYLTIPLEYLEFPVLNRDPILSPELQAILK